MTDLIEKLQALVKRWLFIAQHPSDEPLADYRHGYWQAEMDTYTQCADELDAVLVALRAGEPSSEAVERAAEALFIITMGREVIDLGVSFARAPEDLREEYRGRARAALRAARGRSSAMTDKELIRRALETAIEWELSLADAYSHMPDDPARQAAIDQVARYRRLLKKRYGYDRTVRERLSDKGGPLITLESVLNAAPKKFKVP